MKLWKLLSLLILLKSTVGVSVECNFTDFKSLYTCVSDDLETDSQDSFVTEVSGLHANGKTNKDVQQFCVSNSESLEYFPGGLSNFFPNLESIRIKNSSMKYIFKSDLFGLSGLKNFVAVDNQIEIIGPQLFEDNPLLEEIHLEKNKITSISEDLLDSNDGNLLLVHLYNNECIKNDLEIPNFSATDIKKMIIEKCSLSQQDLIENVDKQVEKLSNHMNNLKENLEKINKTISTPMTSEDNINESNKLHVQVNKLVFEKRNLESNVSFSMQSLDQNAAEIKNLTSQNQDFKLMNDKLEANLTENLSELNAALIKNQDLDALTTNLSKQLASEKLITQSFPSIILTIANNATELRIKQASLEEKLSSTIQQKDDIIANLKSDLSTALSEKEKSEKSDKKQISLLQSVNRELNKKMTLNDANKAYIENMEARYKKFKDQN